MDQPGTLIKFGKLDHLLQFREDGLLYLNNLPYFWNIEDEELRGDPFDCAVQVIRGPKITTVMPDGEEVTICTDFRARIHPSEPEKINIFCMYALRKNIKNSFPIDNKNNRFGDHALILTNRGEFMNRLASTLKNQRIIGHGDLVQEFKRFAIKKVK